MLTVSKAFDVSHLLKPWVGLRVFAYNSTGNNLAKLIDAEFPDSNMLLYLATKEEILQRKFEFLIWFIELIRNTDVCLLLLDADTQEDDDIIGFMLGYMRGTGKPILVYHPQYTKTWVKDVFVGTDDYTRFRAMLEHILE